MSYHNIHELIGICISGSEAPTGKVMGDPKISVIIPNYNRENYISDAIKSVLNQTFHDFEVIVVDDASSDNSVEIINNIISKESDRHRLIRMEKRGGSAAARNLGIKSARGNIICFLDSDDVYAPTKLQKQFDALQEETEPVVVYCDWYRIDENGLPLPSGKRDKPRKNGNIFQDALLQTFGASTMFMIPRICFETVGFYDESLVWAEDFDLTLRLARKFNFKYVDEAIYGYRSHQESKRQVINRKERLYCESIVIEKHFKSGKNLLDEEARNRVVSLLLSYYAKTSQHRKLLRYGMTNFAFRNMVKSLFSDRYSD